MSELPIKYDPANDLDKEYFRELNEACYREVVIRQFGSWQGELQTTKFNVKWQQQNFCRIIRNDRVIGGVWVDQHADSHQLREIQIHPDHQNQGIGTLVVEDVIETAQKEGKRLWLMVLRQNQAVTLYKRLGFTVVDKTETQYIMEYRT